MSDRLIFWWLMFLTVQTGAISSPPIPSWDAVIYFIGLTGATCCTIIALWRLKGTP
jgi:hypothetical protein